MGWWPTKIEWVQPWLAVAHGKHWFRTKMGRAVVAWYLANGRNRYGRPNKKR